MKVAKSGNRWPMEWPKTSWMHNRTQLGEIGHVKLLGCFGWLPMAVEVMGVLVGAVGGGGG